MEQSKDSEMFPKCVIGAKLVLFSQMSLATECLFHIKEIAGRVNTACSDSLSVTLDFLHHWPKSQTKVWDRFETGSPLWTNVTFTEGVPGGQTCNLADGRRISTSRQTRMWIF